MEEYAADDLLALEERAVEHRAPLAARGDPPPGLWRLQANAPQEAAGEVRVGPGADSVHNLHPILLGRGVPEDDEAEDLALLRLLVGLDEGLPHRPHVDVVRR